MITRRVSFGKGKWQQHAAAAAIQWLDNKQTSRDGTRNAGSTISGHPEEVACPSYVG